MEYPHTICGVLGRMYDNQWVVKGAVRTDAGDATLVVTLRFNDACGNGHNTFTMSAELKDVHGYHLESGTLHDTIAMIFPELAGLAQWHGCRTDGPMHYLANTLFHAGNKDYAGRVKGEPKSWVHGITFGDSPITVRLPEKFCDWLHIDEYDEEDSDSNCLMPDWIPLTKRLVPVEIPHADKADVYGSRYTVEGYPCKWYECPFADIVEAVEFCTAWNTLPHWWAKVPVAYSDGKQRELDAARRSAIWPEATDAELTADREVLKAALEARLPDLIAAFRVLMTKVCGFRWE